MSFIQVIIFTSFLNSYWFIWRQSHQLQNVKWHGKEKVLSIITRKEVGIKVYLSQVQTKLSVSHQRWWKRKEVQQQLRPFWVLSPARQFEVWLHTLGSIHSCDPFSTHCHLPATHPSICLPTLTKPLQTNSVRVTSQWAFCNYVLNTEECTGMSKNTHLQHTQFCAHSLWVLNFVDGDCFSILISLQ